MPYIEQRARAAIDPQDLGWRVQNVGELNYVITAIIKDFLGTDPSYADFNGVIGVLESAKLELYRRTVAPYEDEKIKENGDVY